jgi:hypothetical protein
MSRSPSDHPDPHELPAECEPGAPDSEPTAVQLADGIMAASHGFMLFSKRCIDQSLHTKGSCGLALAESRL